MVSHIIYSLTKPSAKLLGLFSFRLMTLADYWKACRVSAYVTYCDT